MSVSRRLRYEILRRDNHTCRYCGASAPDVKLTVDHVVPVALGGTDDPTNLVTACADCNSGKSSTSPDAPMVEDVKADAIRWQLALEQAGRDMIADRAKRDHYEDMFDEMWPRRFARPDDWRSTIWGFYSSGLPGPEMDDAIVIASTRPSLVDGERWRYFCGICHSKLRSLREAASSIVGGS